MWAGVLLGRCWSTRLGSMEGWLRFPDNFFPLVSVPIGGKHGIAHLTGSNGVLWEVASLESHLAAGWLLAYLQAIGC